MGLIHERNKRKVRSRIPSAVDKRNMEKKMIKKFFKSGAS